ncbi:flippase [Agarivorans gilvus]|uniref:O-unit flippase n=1 Tax=Agarivorans gilvus TaxID=680279 RepID=A0ABQ1HZ49_9ALTE|nr:flippase [Agarivorans gilvus]GGA98931.1 O-unit flippase [Agarivorans gilvus]
MLRHAAVRSSLWLIVEKLLSMAISLAVTLAIARHLAPEQFGTLSYLLALAALLVPFSALGLNAIITREVVQRPADEQQIMGTALTLRLCGALLCGGLCLLLAPLYLPEHQRFMFTLLLLGNLFTSFTVIDYWIQARVDNRYAAKMRLMVLSLMAGLRFLAVYFEQSLSMFVYLAALEMLLMGLGFTFLYSYRGGSLRRLTASIKEAKYLLSQSWLLMLSGIAAIIYLKMDQVMLGWLSSSEQVGIYAVAARLSEVWYFFPTAIVTSFFPQLINHRRNAPNTYKLQLQKLNDFLFLGAFLVAILVQFVAPWAINILFGAEYALSAPVLVIHIWAGVFIFMRALLSKWLLVENYLFFSMLTQFTGALLNVLLNYWLIPLYGATGAAAATVLSYAAASYLALFFHKNTWPMALIMTRSLVLPLRLVVFRTGLYK